MIVQSQYPTRFAIIPSDEYVFDHRPSAAGLDTRIVGRRILSGGVEIIVCNIGLLAFDFASSALGAFTRLRFEGSGDIPDAVTDNTDQMLGLQARRLRVATFVTACIYATHAYFSGSGVNGAIHPGLGDILNWFLAPNRASVAIPDIDHERLSRQLFTRRQALAQRRAAGMSITSDHLEKGLDFADRLLRAAGQYVVADPVSLVVMNYQAMVLHARQHAGASVALCDVVIEAALEELMFARGVAKKAPPTGHPADGIGRTPMSRRQLKKAGVDGMIKALVDARVIDPIPARRIRAVRATRNDLMHEGKDCMPRQSGDALTATLDVLRLCTGERQFELIASWGYRD